jgi:hypothetical protein
MYMQTLAEAVHQNARHDDEADENLSPHRQTRDRSNNGGQTATREKTNHTNRLYRGTSHPKQMRLQDSYP